jgi:cardiolipin synthase A/B
MLSGDLLSLIVADRWILATIIGVNEVLAIGFIIREVMRSRTSQGSIAWILSLLLLPIPTTILYAIFGIKLFDDYARLQTESGRVLRSARAKAMTLLDHPATEDWPVLANVSQLPFLAGNDAKLLIDGDATFESMFAGIDRAQKTIFAQFYIIHDDEVGRLFADHLIARAKAGVAVHLLYDDVGTFWLPRAYKRRLQDAGIELASFNQRHRLLRIYGPMRLNYRSHRKIVVVDGEEGWVGGLNVGDEYLGRSKRFGHWRDTHVYVRGPAALALSLTFREDWHWATGEQLPSDVPAKLESKGDQPILVMPTGPADTLEDCAIAFTEVIAAARERLWIVSPYFVPDVDMQTALYAAVLRGVDVRVLIPSVPDHILVWLASQAHANSMIDHGVNIYRYPDGFLHQKVILVDERIAGVGTVNFDSRSFRINFEVTLWFTAPQMIADVTRMLVSDFEAGTRLTSAERSRQSWILRFAGQAARLLSPIL